MAPRMRLHLASFWDVCLVVSCPVFGGAIREVRVVWLNPNFLLLSYSIPWEKGTMKGSSFGHPKQKRKPIYEGTHSALNFSNEATSLI